MVTYLKKFFRGWNAFEIIFLCLAIAVPLTLGLIFGSTWLQIVASSTSLIVAILFAKAKIEGYVLVIVSMTTFVIVAWSERLFGEVIVQLGFALPLYIYGFVNWLRNIRKIKGDGQALELKVQKTSLKEVLLVLIVIIPIGIGVYFLLGAFNALFLLASTFALTTGIIAVYLVARASVFNPIAYITNDISQIVLWSLVLAYIGDIGIGAMLILPCLLAVNDIYALFRWRKKYLSQQSRIEKHEEKEVSND